MKKIVFITLGTQGNQFPRCLQMVEELIYKLHPNYDFVAQLGNTNYSSSVIKCLDFLSETEFEEYIAKADIIISHAGSGALFGAIQRGKKCIAVARLKEYNEMLNNHQTELVRKLTKEGYILDGTYSIISAWNQLDEFIPRSNDFSCEISNKIDSLLKEWGVKSEKYSK